MAFDHSHCCFFVLSRVDLYHDTAVCGALWRHVLDHPPEKLCDSHAGDTCWLLHQLFRHAACPAVLHHEQLPPVFRGRDLSERSAGAGAAAVRRGAGGCGNLPVSGLFPDLPEKSGHFYGSLYAVGAALQNCSGAGGIPVGGTGAVHRCKGAYRRKSIAEIAGEHPVGICLWFGLVPVAHCVGSGCDSPENLSGNAQASGDTGSRMLLRGGVLCIFADRGGILLLLWSLSGTVYAHCRRVCGTDTGQTPCESDAAGDDGMPAVCFAL